MEGLKGITIELGVDDKSKLKLRAIAKHSGALADELLFYFDEEVGEDFYWWAREFKHVEGVLN